MVVFQPGDVVQYRSPFPDEVGLIFTVVEVNGDRMFIRARLDLPICPI